VEGRVAADFLTSLFLKLYSNVSEEGRPEVSGVSG
jgi:hypothetical protein